MKRLLFASKAWFHAARAIRLERRAVRLYLVAQACWAQSAMDIASSRALARGPLPEPKEDDSPAGCSFAGQMLLGSLAGVFIAGMWIWFSARAGR